MKKLVLSPKKYTFGDLFSIPLKICPFWLSALTLIRLALSFLPALQVVAVASVVNTAIDIQAAKLPESQILLPIVFLIGVAGVFALQDFFLFFFSRKVKNAILFQLQSAIAEKRSKLEYMHIENPDTWNVITRAGTDAPTKLMEGYESFMAIIGVFISTASVLWMIMTTIWWTGLLIVGICIPLFLFSAKAGKKRYNEEKETAEKERRADYFRSVLFDRTLIEERALFGYTDAINQSWYSEYMQAQNIRMKARRTNYFGVKTGALLMLLLTFAIVAILLIPLQSGAMSIGTFCGLVTAVINIVDSLGWQISRSISAISKTREYLTDLTALANLSEKPDALTKRVDISDFVFETLEFKNVSFAYPGTNRKILNNLSFQFSSGRNYAVVGINGAGKTTLTKLMCGLYDNYEGEILINGKEIRNCRPEFIKSFFGVVYQDFARYQISLRDNLTLGSISESDDSTLLEAIDRLGMGSWVRALPHGLDTVLGKIKKGGSDLSGGQWQRVAVARCVIAPSVMRILDEPTAALDPIAESEIYSMFSDIIKGQSSIIITHRLGAARMADEIIVIAEGRVAESGPHHKLMDQKGLYSKLFESQRRWYR